jgi:hypothetical protein
MRLQYKLGIILAAVFVANVAWADQVRHRDGLDGIRRSPQRVVDHGGNGGLIMNWYDKSASLAYCYTLACPRFIVTGISF